MCCPEGACSRGPKAKPASLFDQSGITKSNLAAAGLAAAQSRYKSLKLLTFARRQVTGALLGLEGLEAPPGGLVREPHQGGAQLTGGREGIAYDFLAVE